MADPETPQTAATEHPTKVCIDLFSGLGGFSAAFAEEDRTHSELATMLAHAESPDSDVDHKLRKSVYVCLYQTHLGALESHDIITWDQQSGLVTPGRNHGLALQVLRSVVSAPEVSDGAPRLNPDAMADSEVDR